MSEKEKTFRPFSEVPMWKADSEFTITGKEFEHILGVMQLFANGVQATNSIFAKHITNGVITIEYKYEDGTAVPKEDIEEYTKQMTELYAKQTAAQKEQAEGVLRKITE